MVSGIINVLSKVVKAINQRGHYEIPPMQVELGVWQGTWLNLPDQPWLRWWNLEGELLPTASNPPKKLLSDSN
jgi:hypothetical protein